MLHQPQFPFARRTFLLSLLLLVVLAAIAVPFAAQAPPAQDPPPANSSNQTQAQPAKPQEPAPTQSAEMSTRDTAPTFKVRVNLVLVRVVVRDAKGKVVPDLKKDDFQLFDNRKLQTISTFSVETPASHANENTSSIDTANSDAAAAAAAVAALPQRFVSVVFDDQHLIMSDLLFVRNAASKFLNSLAPSDRVAFDSTSGQLREDFTDDHEKLEKSLLGLLPRSATQGLHDCPEIGYYQADLIFNKRDTQALAIATEDAVQCAFNGDETQRALAQNLAFSMAPMVLGREDSSTEYALRHMEEVMRHLSAKPGQRIMVFVSPGFLQSTLFVEFSDIIDRATRSSIVINTIDARGLYTPDMGDIADPPHDSARTAGFKETFRVAEQSANEDVLAQFADGTGGTFFHNRNDVDEGLRQAAAAPALTYLLGFSPQNLKLDGSLHTLRVSFTHKSNYQIQARHAYFAPRHVADPAEAAKQEIQEAIFSQDEIRDLPVDLHTQFFKTTAIDAKLAVVTHVEIKGMHFKKAEGRNQDNLTVATAIFDENGNYITGAEKIIEMKLLDTTYDRLSRSGLNLKSSFDLKPGSYLVRQVVRDSEGEQLAARNGAVVIPN